MLPWWQEKKVVEERLILMGEDDSTLPPEYRPTEEDIKVTRPFTLDMDSRYMF